MSSRASGYVVARIKLAFGRTMAWFADRVFLRRDPTLELVRIGTDYGGWYCSRTRLRAGDTALCCGAGEDVSFDVTLNAGWGMRVICVDPTPRAIRHVASLLDAARHGRAMPIEAGPLTYDLAGFRETHFHFVPSAVWSSDGHLELFAPKDPAHVSYSAMNLQHTDQVIKVRSSTVTTLQREFAVPHLSLLKLDIEGAEYEVLRSMLRERILPEQLLVEFDQVNQPQGAFFWIELVRTLDALRAAGYRLVYRERANYVFIKPAATER